MRHRTEDHAPLLIRTNTQLVRSRRCRSRGCFSPASAALDLFGTLRSRHDTRLRLPIAYTPCFVNPSSLSKRCGRRSGRVILPLVAIVRCINHEQLLLNFRRLRRDLKTLSGGHGKQPAVAEYVAVGGAAGVYPLEVPDALQASLSLEVLHRSLRLMRR